MRHPNRFTMGKAAHRKQPAPATHQAWVLLVPAATATLVAELLLVLLLLLMLMLHHARTAPEPTPTRHIHRRGRRGHGWIQFLV